MGKLVIARSVSEIQRLRPAWESLYAGLDDATMFQSFGWNLLASALFADREQPFVVYVEDGRGRALVPACIREGTVKFLGDELFDYPDVLSGGAGDALRSAWARIERLGLAIEIHGVRSKSWLRAIVAEGVWAFSCAPQVSISSTEFCRQHVRSGRLVRRLNRLGVTMRKVPPESSLVRRLFELKASQQNGGENLFRDAARRRFMNAVVQLQSAPAQLFLLEKGEAIVAALLTFLDRRTRRFYTTYHDPEWSRWSPGAALLFEATRLTLEEGNSCDYMTGEQPYKLRLADARTPLWQVSLPARKTAEPAAELQLAS